MQHNSFTICHGTKDKPHGPVTLYLDKDYELSIYGLVVRRGTCPECGKEYVTRFEQRSQTNDNS